MDRPISFPQNAKIEEIGIASLGEIENHRVEGSIFVQYRYDIHDRNGKRFDCCVTRFNLPVCIWNSTEHPDLRELTLTQIETLLMAEVTRVMAALPSPLRRIDFQHEQQQKKQ
jgi:hypothetical protein